jgi:hypothetical protein
LAYKSFKEATNDDDEVVAVVVQEGAVLVQEATYSGKYSSERALASISTCVGYKT